MRISIGIIYIYFKYIMIYRIRSTYLEIVGLLIFILNLFHDVFTEIISQINYGGRKFNDKINDSISLISCIVIKWSESYMLQECKLLM